MAAIFLIFNHAFLNEQREAAHNELGVTRIVPLPAELQHVWGGINPFKEDIRDDISPIIAWLSRDSHEGDYVLVQGDFGATFLVVQWAFKHGRVPLYATTERHYESSVDGDRIINVHAFKHVRFRRYLQWEGIEQGKPEQ